MPSTSIWSQYSKSSDAFLFGMYLCYLDESGVPEIPGNSTHFVLAGIAVPIEKWRLADSAISSIMDRYGLGDAELHTAWLLRKYIEQSRINDFPALSWEDRRAQVAKLRVAEIHRVRKYGIAKRNSQLKKVFQHTAPYVHLTLGERQALALEVAGTIASWEWARLFGACIDKGHFVTQQDRLGKGVSALAFQTVTLQFALFLQSAERSRSPEKGGFVEREFGLLIHDNNPTVASKHTEHIKAVHRQQFPNQLFERIIETPLFVDSSLTRMVQLADLWGYALRRYIENREAYLFQPLFNRLGAFGPNFDEATPRTHILHYTQQGCGCNLCAMVTE